MAEDLIDKYVDRSGFESDTKFVLDQLNTILSAYREVKAVISSLGKSTGLAQDTQLRKQASAEIGKEADAIDALNKAMAENAAQSKQIIALNQQLADVQKKLAASQAGTLATSAQAGAAAKQQSDNISNLNATLTVNIQKQIELKNRLAEIKANLGKLREFQDAAQDSKEFTDEIIRLTTEETQLKQELTDVNRTIKNQTKEFHSAEGSVNEMRAKLNQLNQAFDALSQDDRTGELGKGLLTDIQKLDAELKGLEGSTGRFQRNVGNYAGSLAGAFEKVTSEITKLQQRNEELRSSFQNLSGGRTTIQGFRTSEQTGIDPNTTAQLKAFTDEIDRNDAALQQLQRTQVEGFTVSKNQTQQVRNLENAYINLATSGQVSNEFLQEFKNAIGTVKDDVQDLRESIKLAASDTQTLDVLIGGAQAIAGSFGVAQGAVALFGDENEELQKTLVKLNGVMTILNGLQAIQNELKKKDNVFTLAQIGLQKIYAFVIGTSTGALKAFRIALAATGVGLLILGLTALIAKFSSLSDSTKDAAMDLDSFNRSVEKSNEQLDDQIEKIERQIELQTILAKQRGASEKELNDISIQGLNRQSELIEKNARLRNEDFKQTLENISRSSKFLAAQNLGIGLEEFNRLAREGITNIDQAKALLNTIKDIRISKVWEGFSETSKQQTELVQKAVEAIIQSLTRVDNASFNTAKKTEEDKAKELEKIRERQRKAAEEAAKRRKELEERNVRAVFEIEKLNIESRIRFNEKIFENERGTLDGRLKALGNYIEDRNELIALESDFELNKAGLTKKERELLEAQKQDRLNQLVEEGIEKRKEIIRSESELEGEIREGISGNVKSFVEKFFEAEADVRKQRQELIKQYAEEERQLYKQLYDELTQTVTSFFDAVQDRELNSIQKKIDLLETAKAKEIEAINDTTASNEEKANRIKIAEARTAAQREQFEIKQREIEKRQQNIQRIGQIATIIGNTAAGVQSLVIKAAEARANAALMLSNPLTAPYAPVSLAQAALISAQIPIVVAIGAAQLARLAVPRFKQGKGDFDNYEGPAVVGDGGKKEAIIREDGKIQITDSKPQLAWIGKEDTVHPDVDKLLQKTPADNIRREKEKTEKKFLETNIRINKEIFSDETKHTSVRLKALNEYLHSSTRLIEMDYSQNISKPLLKPKEAGTIEREKSLNTERLIKEVSNIEKKIISANPSVLIPAFKDGKNINGIDTIPVNITEPEPIKLFNTTLTMPEPPDLVGIAMARQKTILEKATGQDKIVMEGELTTEAIKSMEKNVVNAIRKLPQPEIMVENVIRKRIRSRGGQINIIE